MKVDSLNKVLKPYSIHGRRRTTINGSFASAVVPRENYDRQRAIEAIKLLGQDPDGDLACVYCSSPARTWDHLVPKVLNGLPNGPGHQVGNLVPCCKDCNSRKGKRDWRGFVADLVSDEVECRARIELLTQYHAAFVQQMAAPFEADKELWKEYLETKDQILELMKKADGIARQMGLLVE